MTFVFEGTAERVESGSERELDQLMAGYQCGDTLAAAELVDRLSPLLLRFFYASGVPRHDAEDLLQQCWLRIHRSRQSYRAGEALLPWIFAIARHTKLDAYRKRRRIELREVLVDSYPEAIQQAHAEPEFGRMAELLAALPDSQREVIVLMKVAGMSVHEVARATSSTVGAVKQKAHRAYATLRLMLGEKE
jgi:RNA polymerase sigma-70 factor (ECF subfamily)